jgi:DnaJ-domain-containing protein 1
MQELDPEKGAKLQESLGSFHFRLALNQFRKQDSHQIGTLICKIIEKHLALRMQHIGNVYFDDRVHNAICKRMPFLELYPYTQTALDLRECCRVLLAREATAPLRKPSLTDKREEQAMKPFREQNYYDILEISPDALPLEIRRAYKKAFALYQDDSIASYSFFSEEERQKILARIEQAYLTLINPESRSAYDNTLIASGLLEEERTFRDNSREPITIYDLQKTRRDSPSPARRTDELKVLAARDPLIRDLLARETLGGDDLERIRTVLQVPLEEIAEKTNIRVETLKAIEREV